ncbi:MAG: cupin domain-containing protein [Cytophagales bacterium]|nr:cupin domain-containing protein [Cytophagales bacterium]
MENNMSIISNLINVLGLSPHPEGGYFKAILIIASLVFVFYILIISSVIPYQYVWGGRLESNEQMLRFESISMIINLFIIFIVSIKGGYTRPYLSSKVVHVFLWIFTILFVLNTIGNLLSLNSLEAIIATPITFILALMFLRLAVEKIN